VLETARLNILVNLRSMRQIWSAETLRVSKHAAHQGFTNADRNACGRVSRGSSSHADELVVHVPRHSASPGRRATPAPCVAASGAHRPRRADELGGSCREPPRRPHRSLRCAERQAARWHACARPATRDPGRDFCPYPLLYCTYRTMVQRSYRYIVQAQRRLQVQRTAQVQVQRSYRYSVVL
jgi:hypothetical protein